jgi:hypothetical protein
MSQQINLYNPLYLRQEKHFSAVTMLWSLLALTVLMAGYAAYVSYAVRAPEERFRFYDSMLKSKRSEVADTVARYSPEGRNKQLEADVRTLEGQLVSRKDVWRALNSLELGTGTGFADYLEAFSRRAVPGVWLTGFSIGGGGGDLTIRGRVLQPELVSRFLTALGQEEVMRGRKVVELKLDARSADPLANAAAGPAVARPASPPQFVDFTVRAPAALPEQALPASAPVPAAATR